MDHQSHPMRSRSGGGRSDGVTAPGGRDDANAHRRATRLPAAGGLSEEGEGLPVYGPGVKMEWGRLSARRGRARKTNAVTSSPPRPHRSGGRKGGHSSFLTLRRPASGLERRLQPQALRIASDAARAVGCMGESPQAEVGGVGRVIGADGNRGPEDVQGNNRRDCQNARASQLMSFECLDEPPFRAAIRRLTLIGSPKRDSHPFLSVLHAGAAVLSKWQQGLRWRRSSVSLN